MNICFNADIFGLINNSICKYHLIQRTTTAIVKPIKANPINNNGMYSASSVYKNLNGQF